MCVLTPKVVKKPPCYHCGQDRARLPDLRMSKAVCVLSPRPLGWSHSLNLGVAKCAPCYLCLYAHFVCHVGIFVIDDSPRGVGAAMCLTVARVTPRVVALLQ